MKSTRSALAHRNLPLLLLQGREHVLSRFRAHFNAHGLTDQQWRVLRAIHDEGPLEPRQIGEICCISSPSMAGILARMQELGLVDRVRMPRDQRRVLVSLTASSRALLAQITPRIESTYRELEALLGREFLDSLYAQLDHLARTLREHPCPPANPYATPEGFAARSAGRKPSRTI